jgi:ATP-dependent DNA helicase DinG
MRARDVLGEGGLLARVLGGFELRPAQLRMAEIVERALEGDGVTLVEAGTGTGKTLAYLVPAALHDRRIVISTGTRTLQDQIASHDVPLLERALGERLPIAVLKGLPNYVCRRRYGELLRSAAADADPEIARYLPLVRDLVESSETGDRAELRDLPEDAAIWAAIQSGSDTRIGPRCRHHDACFVTKARRRAEEARIVVVNHHLFFADLALRAKGTGQRERGVIPDYDVAIFDEAHQIEDVATSFFGAQLGSQRVETLVRDAERALGKEIDRVTEGLLRSVRVRGQNVFERVPRGAAPEGGRNALAAEALDAGLRDSLFALDIDLEVHGDALRDRAVLGESAIQLVRRADEIREAIGRIAEPGHAHVAWTQQRGRMAWLGASPVDVSGLFRDEVLHRTKSVVLTSATLATSGSFGFTRQRLGIDFEVDEEVLPSPFEHATQSALYLPDLPDPREGSFAEAAAKEIDALVTMSGGGAFVLCTSVRAMQDFARRLRPAFEGRRLLVMVQGEAPKNAQLDRFRERGDAVLFATQSFWEGVDVPGRALRLVVIDKLPFDVPSDPLVSARCARLEAQGTSAFMEYTVPAAALALKQAFGRLIRTSQDRGVVALLDSRVTKKGYGRLFLRSLPDAKRCTTRAEVEEFWS